ncbi:hypothetical protein [Sulfoacidibacillus thermotolerans]|uniref:Uncharacterized protein n=1 Tax=Sulfoacidibacillus thermotolerans TaxID=1765684 RepID=A0A2U3CT60_SULT2|nr:hypothetical protein [Sulfoacidibacillus thermotolerans]PWI52216.1 hypothetical protein BM613_14150 [Sulfoacidibacillus thermotolerans]
MPKIHIEYTEADLVLLVLRDLENTMPEVDFKKEDIKILVKSKQNYKAEWEIAAFKATIDLSI